MRHVLSILAVFAVLTPALRGEEPDVREPLEKEELPSYEELRDPFWPIGYVRQVEPKVDPSKPEEPEKPVKIVPKWPQLKLKGVTASPKGYIAIIEGIGLVEAGQVVSKTVNGVVYRWRINRITEKGFSLSKIDAKPAGK